MSTIIRFAFASTVVLILSGQVVAFSSKTEEGVVGSREGDQMGGYDGVMFGMTASEAKGVLPALRDEICTYSEKRYPCLILAGPWGEVWSNSQYIMKDGRVWVAIGQVTTIYDKSAWIERKYCNRLAGSVYKHFVSQYGHPDGHPNLKAMDIDHDFPPTAPPGRIDYHYAVESVMFTFPRGGQIKFEMIINRPDNLCQVRAIIRE